MISFLPAVKLQRDERRLRKHAGKKKLKPKKYIRQTNKQAEQEKEE